MTKLIFFLSQLTAELDTSSRDLLEEDLTSDELTKALQSMEDKKTPGEDGLPKEFCHILGSAERPSCRGF